MLASTSDATCEFGLRIIAYPLIRRRRGSGEAPRTYILKEDRGWKTAFEPPQWASTPSVSWCRTPGSGPWFKVRANCGGSLLKLAIYGARADSG